MPAGVSGLEVFHHAVVSLEGAAPMIDTSAQHAFDVAHLRERFPALRQVVRGRVPIFFDNPAGTQVPLDVVDAVHEMLVTSSSYPHGRFYASERSSAAVDGAHAAMAHMLGAASPEEIVIGPNMTTLTFAISRAIGRGLSTGDEIVVTTLDHDGNVAPWRALEERGVVIRVVDINPADCTLDMADLAAKIGTRTRVVAVTHCSNLVGSIVDVARVCRLARQAGALSYIDAVQYAAHGTIDVQALDCDFLVCSSYKFFGPHLGILYGKWERLDAIRPYKVRPATEQLPGRFETGAPSVEGCAGLLGTMAYLRHVASTVGASNGSGDAAPAWLDPAGSRGDPRVRDVAWATAARRAGADPRRAGLGHRRPGAYARARAHRVVYARRASS